MARISPETSTKSKEGLWVEQPPRGVVPADQRLDAVHVAGVQVDLGLEVHDELVARYRSLQLIDRTQPDRAAGVIAVAVDVISLAGGLRLVHGNIGLAQQGAQVRAVVREPGDADADVRVQRHSPRR